jgi:N-acetylmuramoyl-L-alanine amidase
MRDGDSTLSYEQRALKTNAEHAGLYVSVHVGTPGSGVRVYTAMLQPQPAAKKIAGGFVPWDHAQTDYLERSKVVAKSFVTEIGKATIASTYSVAPLKPLNNIAAPAVAIEVTPPSSDSKLDALAAVKYQQAIATAAANAIAEVRGRIEERQ